MQNLTSKLKHSVSWSFLTWHASNMKLSVTKWYPILYAIACYLSVTTYHCMSAIKVQNIAPRWLTGMHWCKHLTPILRAILAPSLFSAIMLVLRLPLPLCPTLPFHFQRMVAMVAGALLHNGGMEFHEALLAHRRSWIIPVSLASFCLLAQFYP